MNPVSEIADVFNHVHQSHASDDPNDLVLADAAVRIAFIVEQAGWGTVHQFLDVAGMSGLPVDVGHD